MLRRWLRRAVWALLIVFVVLPVGLTLLYAVLPPPGTPLMLIRLVEGEGLKKRWVGLDRISPAVPQAVIAAEDNRFCQHYGFDIEAIEDAIEEYMDGDRLRGASTISMQTAKNVFLWPGRSLLRKGLEAYLTVLVELVWSKRRIMEVYLNVVEWSGGVYGVEAAARHYFGKSAEHLTRWEAALLASVLPNPRARSARRPSAAGVAQARRINTRVGQLGPLLDCV